MDQSLVDERILSNVINNLEYKPRQFQRINLDVALAPGLTISKNTSIEVENSGSGASPLKRYSSDSGGVGGGQARSVDDDDDEEAYENHHYRRQHNHQQHQQQNEIDDMNKKRLKRYAELFKTLRYRDYMNRRDDKLTNNLLASYLNKVKTSYSSKQTGGSQTADYKNYSSKHAGANS